MRRQSYRSPVWQGAWLALAVIALLARIGSPPGTMLTPTGHGAQLVLCDGHGPMAMAPDKPMAGARAPVHPAKAHSNGSCEFAAHASHGLMTASLALVGDSTWAPAILPQPIVLAVTGAGLAAPPPPSHAPPGNLV